MIAGSDDPLLYRAVTLMAAELQGRALVSYAAVGTQLGLSVLARRRADVCALHWGPDTESLQRHPALAAATRAAQGLDPREALPARAGPDHGAGPVEAATVASSSCSRPEVRWVARQEGAGSQRFLREIIAEHRLDPADRRTTARAYSERDAAAAIATGQADVAPGVRAAAGEFGLEFLPIGWEAFDLAMSRGVFFRTLFRGLLDVLRGCRVPTARAGVRRL